MASKYNSSSKTKQIAIIVVVALVIIAIIAVLLKVTGVLDAGTSSFSSSSGGGGSSQVCSVNTKGLEFATYEGPKTVNLGDTFIVSLEADPYYPWLYSSELVEDPDNPGSMMEERHFYEVTITGGSAELVEVDYVLHVLKYRISNVRGNVSITRKVVGDVGQSIRASIDYNAYWSYSVGSIGHFSSAHSHISAETKYILQYDKGDYTIHIDGGYQLDYFAVFPDNGKDISSEDRYRYEIISKSDNLLKLRFFNVDKPLVVYISASKILDE